MDADVRLVPRSTSDRVTRIFVRREVNIEDGHRFVGASGSALGSNPETETQAAIFTLSDKVTLEGPQDGSTVRSKFYLYAPKAVCTPGAVNDNPATTGIDESEARSNTTYIGSIVCDRVVLDSADQIVNHAPFPDLVEFGSAGFGSDIFPNNLWFVNKEKRAIHLVDPCAMVCWRPWVR